MNQERHSSGPVRGSSGRWRDLVVLLAIAVVSAALGFGLNQQAGFGVGPSVIGGLGLLVILTFLHVLMRRMQRMRGIEPRVGALEARVDTIEHRSGEHRPGMTRNGQAGAAAIPGAGAPRGRTPADSAMAPPPAAGQSQRMRPASQMPPAGIGQSPADLDEETEVSFSDAGRDGYGRGKVEPEVVDGLVRALAGELGRARAEAATQQTESQTAAEQPVPLGPALSQQPMSQLPQPAPIPLPQQPAAVQIAPQPVPQQGKLIAAIRAAESKGAIEVLLQPVVGLADQKPRFYEVCPRLRAGENELIAPEHYAGQATEFGLLQNLERAMLKKSVTILRRLSERGRARGLFCNISRRLLATAPAMWDLFEVMKVSRPIGELLILELSMADYRALDAIELESLATLARLGYRFSLDGVADAALDVKALTESGFGYVKFIPAIFSAGPRTEADVAQLVHNLSQAGIESIMDGIFDRALIPRFQQLGIRFGQGEGISEPKPVRPELLDGSQGAAAA